MNSPNEKREDRNKRVYHLWKRNAYTMRGLAKLFRISTPRIFEIIKDYRKKDSTLKQ